MSIALKQAPGSLVTPVDDARMYELMSGGQVGIVEGCTVTSLGGNQLKVSAGWGLCLGRQFVVEEETINADVSTSGDVNGRLLIHIDISNDTPISFVTQAAATLPELTQEDINGSGTIYEIPLATYTVGEISISNLVSVTPTAIDLVSLAKTSADAAQTDADTALGRMYVESAGSGYIRFSDGTQICYGSKSITIGSSAAALWGTVLYKASLTLNASFAKAFSASPMISLSSYADWFNVIRADCDSSKISTVVVQGEGTAATVNSKTFSCRYIAIGRWK